MYRLDFIARLAYNALRWRGLKLLGLGGMPITAAALQHITAVSVCDKVTQYTEFQTTFKRGNLLALPRLRPSTARLGRPG